MPLRGVRRDAIIRSVKSFNRSAFFVLLVVLLLWSLAGVFVWLHVINPSDNTRLPPGNQSAWQPAGVVVTPYEDTPDGLRAGDVVTAINGQTLESYARILFDPSAPRPSWRIGQIVQYTILRDGRALELPITLGRYPLIPIVLHDWGTILFAFVSQLVTLFVFLNRPNDSAARTLFLWSAGILSATTWSLGLQVSDLVGGIGFWLFKATTFGAYILFWIAGLHLALIFPSPLLSPKQRWIIPVIYIAPYLLYVVYLVAVYPGSVSTLDWIGRWIPGDSVLSVVYLALSVIALTLNYRASTGAARQKIRWVAFAALVSGWSGLLLWNLPNAILGYSLITPNALGLLILPFPMAIAIAILRHRLFDIDVIINRTLVYGTLTLSTIALYVFVVGYVSNLVQASDRSLIAFLTTGVVAVLFQPLRERLQRGVNRLLYGERDDSYAVLSRLGQRLETTLTPDAILPTIVETIAQALKLPYAAIALTSPENEQRIAATFGQATDDLLRLPLVYQSETIGELILAPRDQDALSEIADRRLLDNLARQVGIAAHAVRLTADLQHSREQLVTTREEERRRIRRDLHDGLGPALASLSLKLDAARNFLEANPGQTNLLLGEIKSQVQAAIADIRRLVYELRPPALDELGLVSAIREQAAQYNVANGLRVSVIAENELPALPAAVEVAAYRIVLEALTNAVRHSHAHHCEIRMALGDALQIEIIDDGIGIAPTHRAGVGLASMRERAAELGGTCVVESLPGGGTRVIARLPVGKV
jgi:two-component system NarL family sensor kinase